MNEGDAFSFILHCVFNRLSNEPLGSERTYGLYSYSAQFADVHPVILDEVLPYGGRFLGAALPLDSRVYVFCVFPEYHDVELAWNQKRIGCSLDPSYGPYAGVEIKYLPEGNVKAPYSTSHRGGKRALDGDDVLLYRVGGRLGKPFAGLLVSLLAGQYFEPGYLLFSFVGLLDRGVEHYLGRVPDIRAYAVAFYERNYRVVGNYKLSVFLVNLYFFSAWYCH